MTDAGSVDARDLAVSSGKSFSPLPAAGFNEIDETGWTDAASLTGWVDAASLTGW